MTAGSQPGGENPLWLPPAAERRSSLAISALLGSPQHDTRTSSRPPTGDGSSQTGAYPYPYPGAPAENHDAMPRPDAHGDDKKQVTAE